MNLLLTDLFSEFQVFGVWPPSTAQWTWGFIVALLVIVALVPWRRGRFLLILTGLTLAAAIGVVLIRCDSRIALSAVAVMFLAAVTIGCATLRILGFEKPDALCAPEWIGFGALLGFGLFSMAAGVLSVAGWLNRATALAVVSIGGFAGCWLGRNWWPVIAEKVAILWHTWRKEDLRWPAFGTAGLMVLAAGPLTWALAPSVQWDALSAHLPTSAALVSNSGFGTVAQYWFAYVPGQAYLLYAMGLCGVGQPAPELIHFTFGALVTVLVFAAGSRVGGRPTAWVAALLFASMPIVGWEAGSAYIDLVPTGFGFGAMYALLRWGETRLHPWLLVSGWLMGLAASSKPSAAFVLCPGILYIVFVCVRQRRDLGWAGSTCVFAVPVALFLAPWYLRNWHWKHNPFYPSMAGIFHNSEVASFHFDWSHFGVGKGFLYFLRLPYDLTLHGHAFDESGYVAFGFVPVLAVAGAVLSAWTVWRPARAMAWLLAGTTACWFVTAQVSRYLLPIMPMAALLAALPVTALCSLRSDRSRKTAVVLLAIAGGVSLGYLRGVSTRWNYNIADGYPYRHALGMETQQQYLRRALRIYPAIEHINRRRSAGSKVYSPTSQMRWYLDAPLDDPVFRSDLAPLAQLASGDALATALRGMGYDYILVDAPLTHGGENQALLNPEFLARQVEPEYVAGEVSVYKLRRTPLSDNRTGELLWNGGFDTVSNNTPAGWFAFGKPLVRAEPRRAHSAPAFVEVSQEDGYYQRVPIVSAKTYILRLWTRADEAHQSAWLEVVWMDRDLKILDSTINVVPVTAEWQQVRGTFTASDPRWAYAQIYARAAAGSHVHVDDASFAPR